MTNHAKIILIIISAIVILLVSVKSNLFFDSEKGDYTPTCISCKNYDLTDFIKVQHPDLFNALNNNASDVVVKYDRFMSKKGKLSLFYTNKNNERKVGFVKDIDPNSIKWSILNDLQINIVNGRFVVTMDDTLFKSNNMVLWNAITEAYQNSLSK